MLFVFPAEGSCELDHGNVCQWCSEKTATTPHQLLFSREVMSDSFKLVLDVISNRPQPTTCVSTINQFS